MEQGIRAGADKIVVAGNLGGVDAANAMALQSDGKIIVGGDTSASGGTDFALVRYRATTAQESLQRVITDVGGLVADGSLTQGEAHSLIAKLQAALQDVNAGNTTAAKNQLTAFINEVKALVAAGKLSAAEGQTLIAAANDILAQL